MDNQIKFESVLVLLLRLGTFLCFAGWTWGHLYWEGPYGVLLWQEDTHALANWLGLTWEEFVGTGANDGRAADGVGHDAAERGSGAG